MHFVPYYPPDRVGGVGLFASQLHEGLLRRGVDSVVVTRGSSASREGVRRIATGRWGWLLGSLRFVAEAARCDVVHVQSGEALPVLLALRLWPGRKARTLATFHVGHRGLLAAEAAYRLGGRRFAADCGGRLLPRLHGLVDALSLRLADATNAISRSTARDLLGPDRGEEMKLIYNPVAKPLPADGEPASEVELFYAGVAGHRKRVLALPFVLQAVRRELPGARLRIAGFHMREAPELEALFAELDLLGAVECLGPLAPERLPPLYRAARVLVVPSAYEGLPYVILEALREGTPVVATRVSGHPEVIEDGVNGRLVPCDEPEAMAAACLELLGDPERAARFGEAGRRTVAERFDLERQLDAYLDYYRALARGES